MLVRILLLTTLVLCFSGCEKIAVLSTSPKQPQASQSDLAKVAEQHFWENLHDGDYQHLPETTRLLTAAYLENPNDPKLAAHLGFVHIWKITERAREKQIPPTITDEIILAKHYFKDAVNLEPRDARFQGFLGDSILVTGSIAQDKREEVHGYFQIKRAIAEWPEFNYFTGGYVMSTLPASSDHYKEGLEWQWKTLDLCTGTKLDRQNPDYRPYMKLETDKGPKRACWNSWIAPHNFEGFFLNMGDMLTKQGDWKTAIKIYNNAKLSKSYASWPYKRMLEKRIAEAERNVAYFQENKGYTVDRSVLFNSGRGCVACHQKA